MGQYNLSVKLTPTGHYFFGTENRTTEGKENYFQYSSQLPQQTMVLGMLRFLLLQTSSSDIFYNGLIQNKRQAGELIGFNSFNMSNKDFGVIKNISEIALWNNEESCLYLPMLVWKDKDKNINYRVNSDTDICNFYGHNNHGKPLFYLPEYCAKNEIYELWITTGGKCFNSEQKLFTEYIHAGNFKNKNHKNGKKVDREIESKKADDEDAYFKMQYYRLHPQFSFLLNIEVDDSVIEQLKGKKHFVYIGGEKSQFSCEIAEITDEKYIERHYADIYDHYIDEKFTKVILTSDTYSENNPYEKSLLAITQLRQFRFLHSSVKDTEEYYSRTKQTNNKKVQESDLFNLLQRGSIFYFEKDEDITEFLDNPVFSTIGYNKYYKLKK